MINHPLVPCISPPGGIPGVIFFEEISPLKAKRGRHFFSEGSMLMKTEVKAGPGRRFKDRRTGFAGGPKVKEGEAPGNPFSYGGPEIGMVRPARIRNGYSGFA